MQDYWNRPVADGEVFVDEYLRTSDVKTIDENGFVAIAEKLNDIGAIGGFSVYPTQFENVLYIALFPILRRLWPDWVRQGDPT